MTAPKKPYARRVVFDATFGDNSLNKNTPDDYPVAPYDYNFPQVDDFKALVLEAGKGCFIWKRDLSRYYLQIPLDPLDYPYVCTVWRNQLFFFTSLMFGLRHSGLQGQRLTSAVTWIHRKMGFCSVNYSDDIGGCERERETALQSFHALGSLLVDLGLVEALDKAHPPSTNMVYLGVTFDTVSMTMSIPGDKLQELREDLSLWSRKKKASKRNLQQLLGKLFWVSRCVRYSRGFMARLLAHLRELNDTPDHRKQPLPDSCKDDIKWWCCYVRRFNGVELIYPEAPQILSLDELLETDALVYCGDAYPRGGGGFYSTEYWSREFPSWLSDNDIPIHVKEFWVLVASTVLWGENWRGSLVYFFCDNAAVVEVLDKEKPRDPTMAAILREFLYLVCTRNFIPVFRHIGTEKNFVADFLSRNHSQPILDSFIGQNQLELSNRRDVPDAFFKPLSTW